MNIDQNREAIFESVSGDEPTSNQRLQTIEEFALELRVPASEILGILGDIGISGIFPGSQIHPTQKLAVIKELKSRLRTTSPYPFMSPGK